MTTPRMGRFAEALFSLGLAAYPRAFRRRFGHEMRDDWRRRGPAGGGAWRVTVAMIRDGVAERRSAAARMARPAGMTPHLYESTGPRAAWWDGVRADLRHAWRRAIAAPVFTALTVLALALGIGANSAIFTVVNGVLLQPLPYRDPDRLVLIWSDNRRESQPRNPTSPANFLDWRQGVADLADLEGFASFIVNNQMRGAEGPERVFVSMVGTRMFAMLGREPHLGRTFAPDDTDVVVLGHGFWQRRFGGDPSVVGRHLTIGSTVRRVIGVMPPGFVFPYRTMLGPDGFARGLAVDLYTPWSADTDAFSTRGGRIARNVHFLAVLARLQPGVSVESLQARLTAVAAQIEAAYPDSNSGWGATVVPAHEQTVGAVRPALLVLFAGVGLILLMACVNVANLALAQGLRRSRELAVRAALGAGRSRLIRQSLTENLLLAIVGAAAALVFVRWGVQVLEALAPATLPRVQDIEPDGTVVGFTLIVGVAAGLVVGLVPALVASRADVRDALHENGHGTAGPSTGHRRLRALLVVGDVALAVVLTTGAGLLLRSFALLLDVDPGFRSEGLLTLQVELPARVDGAAARNAYYDEMFERLRALPGVLAAGGTTRLPLGSTSVSTTVDVEGRPRPEGDLPEVQFRRAVDDYFGAMGIPVRRGRAFTREDGPDAPRVCVINETMAARLFPGEDPVGRRIRTGPSPAQSAWITIVGVVGDVRHAGLDETPAAEMYIAHRQGPPVAPFLVIRTASDPALLAEVLRADLRSFDPALAVYDVRSMTDVRAESVAERRFILVIAGAFGVVALLLAALGVYGVVALGVSERTREMGLRVALGAEPGAVVRMVVGQAARLSAAGVGVGLLLTTQAAPFLGGVLYGVAPADPITFAGVSAMLLTVGVAAAALPARRAVRAGAMAAMRME